MLSMWQKIREKIIKSAKQQDDSRYKDAPSPPVLRAELQIPQTVIDRYDASQHKNETREWWRVVIDGGAFIFAVLGFYILYRTLVVTQETLETTREAVVAAQTEARAAVNAAEIARKQMELSERPWVSVDVTLTRSIGSSRDGLIWLDYSVSLKNVGHSVAMNIRDYVDIILYSPRSYEIQTGEAPIEAFMEPRMRRDELCEEIRQTPPPGHWGAVLFPDQKTVVKNGVAFDKKELIEKRAFDNPPEAGKFVEILLVGCVGYETFLSPTPYVTGFIYSVSANAHQGGFFRVGETVPVKNITVRPNERFGVYVK